MAVFCHFPNPNLTSLPSSHKLLLSSSVQLPTLSLSFPRHHNDRCSRISASSSKNQRRKAKGNAELCNEIKEFLSSVGLPENHVPSMKEFSQHGRQDLANIVRRRGYKYIRQMLEESNATGLSNAGQTGKSEELTASDCEAPHVNLEILCDDKWSMEGIQVLGSNNGTVTGESSTLSLREKVAKFIELGELDAIEDCGLDIRHANEAEQNSVPENADKPNRASSDPQGKDLSLSFSSGEETLYENAPPSHPKIEDPAFEELMSNGKDLDSEAWKLEDQAEIERLKSVLHQKETELAQLKQQIEKEKLFLSDLLTEAKTEINRMQQLISEKATQLQSFEESLSDLKEVEVIYPGHGKYVELAGSFNGWHNTIKMDLQTPDDLRMTPLWRAVLWLYPGVYEIKFVVDGQWRINPHRESITRNSIPNNILRVDK